MVEFVADQLPTTPCRTPAGLSVGFEGGEVMSVLEIATIGKLPHTALGDATFAHPRAGGLTEQFVYGDGSWLIDQNSTNNEQRSLIRKPGTWFLKADPGAVARMGPWLTEATNCPGISSPCPSRAN
jgi:hypothetical protein